MRVITNRTAVGVIVGRFQVHQLHDSHIELIETVKSWHSKVIIVLGVSPVITANNPLDFEARFQMLRQLYPDVLVMHVVDAQSDHVWSSSLDTVLGTALLPGQTVTLYGGRDSFIKHYTGKFGTLELESTNQTTTSGTELRRMAAGRVLNEEAFRAGVIFGVTNQYPKVYPTVDIAIFNEDRSKLLLARKPNETGWRFVGGFADPRSESYEVDAAREAREETGLEISPPEYVGSTVIDDWRYRGSPDKIKTLLFACKKLSGAEKPTDDISDLGWFKWPRPPMTLDHAMHPEHMPLYELLRSWCEPGWPGMPQELVTNAR